MIILNLRLNLGLGALILLAGTASAQVTSYATQFTENWEQTDDAGPAIPFNATFLGSITTTNPADMTGGYWKAPSGVSTSFINVVPNVWYGYGQSYTSIPEMTADLASGDYLFSADLTAGTTNENLNVSGFYFPDDYPFLIGGSYSALQLAPSGTDATILYNPFGQPGDANYLVTNTFIYDYTNTYHYQWGSFDLGGTSTSTTIPGAELKSGRYYILTLGYYAEKITDNDGFGGATSVISYSRTNSVGFQIQADPGTVAGVITLENTNFVYGSPIDIEVLDSGGNILEHHAITIDYYGHYAIDSALTGVHSIRYKGKHWLSSVVQNVDFGVGQNTVNVSLRNGDVDGDNVISIFDYIVISDYFDKSNLDADWYDVGSNGWAPADADLDNDGYVTIFDYIYMSDVFDQEGE